MSSWIRHLYSPFLRLIAVLQVHSLRYRTSRWIERDVIFTDMVNLGFESRSRNQTLGFLFVFLGPAK